MQVADAYLCAFSTRDDRSRTVPIVMTAAVHVLIAFGIAMSTGYVPTFTTPKPTEWVAVPEKVKPPPVTTIAPPDASTNVFVPPRPNLPDIPVEQIAPPVQVTQEAVTDDRVGGTIRSVEQPFTQVRLLSSGQPDYPPIARMKGEEGIVTLRITITPYGTIGDVQLEKSSGYSRLDEAALKAVRAWRFAPARRGGEAIVSSVLVPVKFEIK